MPISLVAASAMAYWGRFNKTDPLTLPVGRAFRAAGGRDWLVKFWELDRKWVGIAYPFGIILWILFFFDHNVSVGYFNSFRRGLEITESTSRSWRKARSFL